MPRMSIKIESVRFIQKPCKANSAVRWVISWFSNYSQWVFSHTKGFANKSFLFSWI